MPAAENDSIDAMFDAVFDAGPLEEIMVLDLSTVGPASRCSRLLADYGASVVKVAPVPGPGEVQIVPPFFAYSGQRAMKRMQIDLKATDGRAAFLAVAARADVIIESFRPGVVARLGIGYEDVLSVNPRIVYCSTSGYGQVGSRAEWAGHDIDYLAVGGYLAMCEVAHGGGPPIPGATIADAAAGGMHAALAITAALAGRGTSGSGAYLDVSVTNGVRWLMSMAIDEHLATDIAPEPGHDILTGRYACYGVYRTGDDRSLAVGAIEQKFFANLCRALGCERWIDHQMDDAMQDRIRSDFQAVFSTRDRDAWVAMLSASDTCVAPVLSVAESASDAAFEGLVMEATRPTGSSCPQLVPMLAGTVRPESPANLPDPGITDTVDLLSDAGMNPGTIDEWQSRGVIA